MKSIARNSELLTVTGDSDPSKLEGLTLTSYHRLVSFLVERDNEWRRILGDAPVVAYGTSCGCDSKLEGDVYREIRECLKEISFRSEEVYPEALRNRLLGPRPPCSWYCLTGGWRIEEFIDKMVEERESLCDKLLCDKRYVELPPTVLPPPMSLFPGLPGGSKLEVAQCPQFFVGGVCCSFTKGRVGRKPDVFCYLEVLIAFPPLDLRVSDSTYAQNPLG